MVSMKSVRNTIIITWDCDINITWFCYKTMFCSNYICARLSSLPKWLLQSALKVDRQKRRFLTQIFIGILIIVWLQLQSDTANKLITIFRISIIFLRPPDRFGSDYIRSSSRTVSQSQSGSHHHHLPKYNIMWRSQPMDGWRRARQRVQTVPKIHTFSWTYIKTKHHLQYLFWIIEEIIFGQFK